MQKIYTDLLKAKTEHKKKFAVLIDPDKIKTANVDQLVELANMAKVDYFFLGGSLVINNITNYCIKTIKQNSDTPIILFPGSSMQLTDKADAVLFLSLISGRNPDLLIGKHVESAPFIKKSGLEVLPTGYMLVDGGAPTSASYMSNTFPIPANKDEIAVCTAMAGELLGLKNIYMDAGSGAPSPINTSMIKAVSSNIDIPLIVGGGIRTPKRANETAKAGADVVVVGNAFEKDPTLVIEMVNAVHETNPIPTKVV